MADHTNEQFTIAYDGPALAGGTMDVHDLAPALIAVGDLCREVNRVVNGDRAKVSVRVSSEFRPGSFEVALTLDQSLIEHVRTALFIGSSLGAHDLLEILGFINKNVKGLLQFVKWLRGRTIIKAQPTVDGHVSVTVEGNHNQVFVISDNVRRAFEDPLVRAALERIVEPLEKPGVDKFEVRQGRQAIESVAKDEAPYFANPEISLQDELLLDSTTEAVLQVVRASFSDELTWTFSDGGAEFGAPIYDREFLERVQRRELAFATGDALRVQLHVKQMRRNGRLHTTREIVEVVEVIAAPVVVQGSLFDPKKR